MFTPGVCYNGRTINKCFRTCILGRVIQERRDMGDKISLKLDEREAHGKKVRALRREGLTPGVVYGPGMAPVPVQADSVLMNKVYAAAGKHAPVHLTIGGKARIAMIKDAEINPVRNSLSHVSFHAVKANEPVVAEVPIRLVGEGESEAEKAGLIILQNIESLEVKALPMDLPDALELDVTGLVEAGEKLTVADLKVPSNVELVDHESGHGDDDEEQHSVTELQVVSVWEPSALAAQNDAAGGDATDESEVEAENGADAPQDSDAEESNPGGKGQDDSK